MSQQTLLLNSDYQPLRVISWQRAVCLWAADKVEVVEEYSDFDLKSVRFTMKCPAVIRLVSYVTGREQLVKFSKKNVFSRDNFTCLYCGKQPGTENLTRDHVLPRSKGGVTSWENLATACLPCNIKKGDRTPDQANMRLKTKPSKPNVKAQYKFTFNETVLPGSWVAYLPNLGGG